jgi:hypothetical protein
MPAILDDTRLWMVIIVGIMISFPLVIWEFGQFPSSSHPLSPKQKCLVFVLRIVLSESLFGLGLLVPLGRTVGGCDRMFEAPTQCPVNAPAWIWAQYYALGALGVVSLLLVAPLEFSRYFRRSSSGS